MEFLKLVVVIAAGLSVTWAAGVIAPGEAVGRESGVIVAQTEAETDSQDVEVELEEVTQDEIDSELEKIQEALDSGEELEEFKPGEPLPADLRLDLPSDI